MLVQHDLPADLVVQGDADSGEGGRIDFAEIDRLFGDRARLIMHPELGRTLEARRTIAPGELILREAPLLIASGMRSLPKEMRRRYQKAVAEGTYNLDDLLILHAFARAPAAVRRRVLYGFCAEECCEADHPILRCGARVSAFVREHDPECAALPEADMLRAAIRLERCSQARRAGVAACSRGVAP